MKKDRSPDCGPTESQTATCLLINALKSGGSMLLHSRSPPRISAGLETADATSLKDPGSTCSTRH